MKEKQMYPILVDFLQRERGFERVGSYRYKFGGDIGQRDVGFDVLYFGLFQFKPFSLR